MFFFNKMVGDVTRDGRGQLGGDDFEGVRQAVSVVGRREEIFACPSLILDQDEEVHSGGSILLTRQSPQFTVQWWFPRLAVTYSADYTLARKVVPGTTNRRPKC
jgi:hypothetical protein